MRVALTPTWGLSTEHAKCVHGEPVLVHRDTAIAYRPGETLEAYPYWGVRSAADVVAQLAKMVRLDVEARRLVDRFMGVARPEDS